MAETFTAKYDTAWPIFEYACTHLQACYSKRTKMWKRGLVVTCYPAHVAPSGDDEGWRWLCAYCAKQRGILW